MLVANRLLPADVAGKGDWEQGVFWVTWAMSLLHAGLLSAPVALARINLAWRQQCWLIAGLAAMAVVLNAVTTGDHLLKTLWWEPYWPVAGVDLSLLVVASVAVLAARHLARRIRATTSATAEPGAMTVAALDTHDEVRHA